MIFHEDSNYFFCTISIIIVISTIPFPSLKHVELPASTGKFNDIHCQTARMHFVQT